MTGLVGGLIIPGLVVGPVFGRGDKIPKRMGAVQWRQLLRRGPLVVGLGAGLMVWLWPMTGIGITHGGIGPMLVAGLMAGLIAWLVARMSRPGTDRTSPLSPLASWRSDRVFGLMVGLAAAFVFALATGLVFGLAWRYREPGSRYGPETVLEFGLLFVFWIAITCSQTWPSSLAFAQLAASDRTPVRLMRLLEDAHRRNVLRTVGPVYQFRHARLQDRLADQESATRQGTSAPHPTPHGPAPAAAAHVQADAAQP